MSRTPHHYVILSCFFNNGSCVNTDTQVIATERYVPHYYIASCTIRHGYRPIYSRTAHTDMPVADFYRHISEIKPGENPSENFKKIPSFYTPPGIMLEIFSYLCTFIFQSTLLRTIHYGRFLRLNFDQTLCQ